MKYTISLLLCFIGYTSLGQAVKEKVLFIQPYYECTMCHKHFLWPDYIPDVNSIKNATIQSELSYRANMGNMLYESSVEPVKNSRCHASQDGQHEWELIKAKSPKKYILVYIDKEGKVIANGW